MSNGFYFICFISGSGLYKGEIDGGSKVQIIYNYKMTPNRSHKNEAAARVDGRPKMATRRQEAGAGARASPVLNTDISHEWEGESRPGHNM